MAARQLSSTFLGLDTASTTVSVALGNAQGTEQQSLPIGNSSTALLNTIQSLLRRRRMTVGELDGILCTAGPGSFTGLRIGMATVMGLSESLEIPATALPSLWIQAHWANAQMLAAGEAWPRIASALTAYRDQFYVQIFRSGPTPRSDGPITTVSRLTEELVDQQTPLVSNSAAIRSQANMSLTLDPGPLATHLVALALANPPAPPLSASNDRTNASAPPFQWHLESLTNPLYAQTPAVAMRPRSRPSIAAADKNTHA